MLVPFRIVLGIGGFGARVVGNSRDAIARRRGYPLDPTEYLLLAAPPDAEASSAPPATTRRAARESVAHAPDSLYDRLKHAYTACVERTEKFPKLGMGGSPRPKAVYLYVVGSLTEAWFSGVLFDVVSLTRSALHPREVRVLTILSTAARFSNLEQEVRDKANIYASLRELDHLLRGGVGDFHLDHGPRIPVRPGAASINMCFLLGEPTGAETAVGTVSETAARFLTALTTSKMGIQVLDGVLASPAYADRRGDTLGASGLFSSVGVSCGRVPRKDLKKYCAARFAVELVNALLHKRKRPEVLAAELNALSAKLPLTQERMIAEVASRRASGGPLARIPARPQDRTRWTSALKAARDEGARRVTGQVVPALRQAAQETADRLDDKVRSAVNKALERHPSALTDCTTVLQRLAATIQDLAKTLKQRAATSREKSAVALARPLEPTLKEDARKKGPLGTLLPGFWGGRDVDPEQAWAAARTGIESALRLRLDEAACEAAQRACERWSASIDRLLSCLDQHRSRLREVSDLLASDVSRIELIPRFTTDEMLLVADDFPKIYEKKVAALRERRADDKTLKDLLGMGLFRRCDRDASSREMYDDILTFAAERFAFLDTAQDLAARVILKDGSLVMGKAGIERCLATLARKAEPLWPFADDSEVSTELELTFLGADSRTAFKEAFSVPAERKPVMVSMREPHRLYVFRTCHSLRLEPGRAMQDLRERYFSVPAASRREMHTVEIEDRLPDPGKTE